MEANARIETHTVLQSQRSQRFRRRKNISILLLKMIDYVWSSKSGCFDFDLTFLASQQTRSNQLMSSTQPRFYASWCKSCQKMGMQYERIGKEIGDLVITNKDGTETVVKSGEIRLAQIEYGANRKLCKSLDVKKVPSVHFYSERKKVDGFPCGPKKIAMLLEKLSHYRSLSLVELSFEADMNEGSALADRVLETLCEDEESTSPQCITDQDS